MLHSLARKEKEKQALSTELERYKVCDPQVLKEISQQTKVAVDAANRWTGKCINHTLFMLEATPIIHV